MFIFPNGMVAVGVGTTNKEMKEEETIRICIECGEPTEERSASVGSGWDGWTVCPGCRTIDPETEEITLEEYERRIY